MVSLAGAEAAQPYVTEINNLNAAVIALTNAIAQNNASIWKISLDYYDNNGTSHTILILDTCSAADTNAILWDIKNILANKINIQTNSLGAIT